MVDPSGVHDGRYDSDDLDAATDAVMEAASLAEPGITAHVLAVGDAAGGSMERLDTRFKSRSSVSAKLVRFRTSTSPHYRLERFNDALRYTILFPELAYWRGAAGVVEEFRRNGWQTRAVARGWAARGYKGLNLTIVSPDRFHFEVQLHTAPSLAAAIDTHDLYVEQRDLSRRSRRWRALEQAQQEVWKAVPVPPGRLEIS